MTLRHKQIGAAAVELAFLLPPLILLAFGTAQFGRAVSQYNTMVKNVRDGARHLSLYAPGDAARIAQAKELVVFGCIRGSTACPNNTPPSVPGLTQDLVRVLDRISNPSTHNLQPVTVGGITVGVMNLVTIEITNYEYDLNVPNLIGPSNFTFTVPSISQTMMQVL